jgi:hypothetical protein
MYHIARKSSAAKATTPKTVAAAIEGLSSNREGDLLAMEEGCLAEDESATTLNDLSFKE